jgi:hypothetical protein
VIDTATGMFHIKKKLAPIFSRPTLKRVMFLRKFADKTFSCGHSILTEGVFVTELSGDGGSEFDGLCGWRQTAVSRGV